MHRKTVVVTVVLAAGAALAFSFLTPGASAQEPDAGAMADGIFAIYFHGNVRCATCKKIESYADEAVQTGFPESARRWRSGLARVQYRRGGEHALHPGLPARNQIGCARGVPRREGGPLGEPRQGLAAGSQQGQLCRLHTE